jgi:hypothetical protein
VDLTRTLTLTNVSATPDALTVTVVPFNDGPVPSVDINSLQLAKGGSQDLNIHFQASLPAPGEYQGYIVVHSAASSIDSRIPYWFGVPSNVPKFITILEQQTTGKRRSQQFIYYRITDVSGIPVSDTPTVTVESGDGVVQLTESLDDESPGLIGTAVRLGATAGDNAFRITLGDKSAIVHITGQ